MSGGAGRVFHDGFETGTTNLWSQNEFRNRCQVVTSAADGGPGPVNQYMARCNWNGTVAWNDPAAFETLVLDTSNYDDELFIRVWVRPDRNLTKTDGSPAKILRINAYHPTIVHDILFNIYNTAGLVNGMLLTSGWAGGGYYWGGAPGDNTTSPNAWHKVEMYIKHTGGIYKLWHDGILVRNLSGLDFEGLKWSPLYITSNFSDSHGAVNYVYFDQIEVYSDRRTGATGLMSNASIR
jgi:hypothetical protein